MVPSLQSGGRRGFIVATAITALLALVGAVLIAAGFRGSEGPPAVDESSASAPVGAESAVDDTEVRTRAPREADRDDVDFGPVLTGSPPVALDIPSIDVHSDNIVGLGLANDGSLEVPRDPSAPGWFTEGPSPGQFGPAVIAGHVDSQAGPAVFYRLGELNRGDQVSVTRQDGSVATFVIDSVESYKKAEFPTRDVYSNTTNRAELRLITCGGEFDDDTGHYLDNTVAFAHLVD